MKSPFMYGNSNFNPVWSGFTHSNLIPNLVVIKDGSGYRPATPVDFGSIVCVSGVNITGIVDVEQRMQIVSSGDINTAPQLILTDDGKIVGYSIQSGDWSVSLVGSGDLATNSKLEEVRSLLETGVKLIEPVSVNQSSPWSAEVAQSGDWSVSLVGSGDLATNSKLDEIKSFIETGTLSSNLVGSGNLATNTKLEEVRSLLETGVKIIEPISATVGITGESAIPLNVVAVSGFNAIPVFIVSGSTGGGGSSSTPAMPTSFGVYAISLTGNAVFSNYDSIIPIVDGSPIVLSVEPDSENTDKIYYAFSGTATTGNAWEIRGDKVFEVFSTTGVFFAQATGLNRVMVHYQQY